MNIKLSLTLVLLTSVIIPVTSYCQWTTSGTNIYNTNSGKVGIGIASPSRTLTVARDFGIHTSIPIIVFTSTASSNKVWDITSGNDLIINETAIANRLTIKAGGNIGIGTLNPQAKLAVNGNILANEIKIKTDITVPDYVFDEDYPLSPLKEIETYIKKNRHLPETPSAVDIKRDGLNVAEMNLLLLKKVEELTLYIIKQDQLTKEVMKRLEDLEKNNK